MNRRALIAVVFFAVAQLGHAQQPAVRKSFRADHKFTLSPGGVLVLDNPVGSIEVAGVDGADIQATTITNVIAANAASLEDGRKQTNVIVGGDTRTRILRTNVSPNHNKQWQASVDWTIRVPRTTHVRVISVSAGRIRVLNVAGNVHVKNLRGNVVVHGVTGNTTVESTNGSITYIAPTLGLNAFLSTVNGNVTASVPPSADFRWVAETVNGDIRTNLPARGAFFGNTYRGTVNAPGGPTLTMATLIGHVHLLANGTNMTASQSVRQAPGTIVPVMVGVTERNPIKGFYKYATNLGDVKVPQINGDADIFTGAGQVQLGAVSGNVKVESKGGPMQFGEIMGVLQATTKAGDILVDTARRGGVIITRGGTIRLLYTSGPTRLVTGGGDIIVRQAAAPVNAETTSGDISITVDARSKTESVEARTSKGNVVLHVPVNFSADVEATIITADPEADTIASDLPGLSISKEPIGQKTRVRAVGKINGGGEKLLLEATGGDIRITTASSGPTVVRPR